jgi:hypothetical protein
MYYSTTVITTIKNTESGVNEASEEVLPDVAVLQVQPRRNGEIFGIDSLAVTVWKCLQGKRIYCLCCGLKIERSNSCFYRNTPLFVALMCFYSEQKRSVNNPAYSSWKYELLCVRVCKIQSSFGERANYLSTKLCHTIWTRLTAKETELGSSS